MRTPLATVLLCLFVSLPARAQEAVPAEPPIAADALPETIVITGQRPGPGLWKVSNGDKVLWLFGTYGPLPKDFSWRSQQAETLLAQSQELIYPPAASYKPNFFRALTLLPHAIGIKKNPDGATLRERVPADVYARWLLLKRQYIGENNAVERERPYFAAQLLYQKGLAQAGLTGGQQVHQTIERVAKQAKLKIVHPSVALEVDDPAALIKQYKKAPLEDATCFAATLRTLESDIDAMRLRATAWAKGDIGAMRSVGFADPKNACDKAFTEGPGMKELFEGQAVKSRMRTAWLDAARKALQTNRSSFGIMPIEKLLDEGDLIAALRAEGFTVESPE